MLRTLVTLGLIVCLVCVLKVAMKESQLPKGYSVTASGEAERPTVEPDPLDLLRPYPTAQIFSDSNFVMSPFAEGTLLDVSRFVPGQLVRCQQTNQPFYVPHASRIDYGRIVGQWQLEVVTKGSRRHYRVQFHADLDRIIGRGELTHQGDQLVEQMFRSRIELVGMFRENEFLATYREFDRDQLPISNGKFRWLFSSQEGTLSGVMMDELQGEFLANARRRIISTEMIPSHGTNAVDFVPKDWRLVDYIDGPLPSVGHYLAMVIEPQDQAFEDRWLLLAHCESGSLFHVVFISDQAIEPRRASPDDTFRGLFRSELNQEGEPKPGLFAIRHDNSSQSSRTGSDFWFQFAPDRRQWLLVEGRSYYFDLTIPDGLHLSRHQPGVELPKFSIHHPPPLTGTGMNPPRSLISRSKG